MSKSQINALKKAMKSGKCSYPGCGDKSFMSVGLPIGKLTESGQIEFTEEGKDSSVRHAVPLCGYHFGMSTKGIIRLIKQDGLVRLVAAFEIIDIVEGVLEGRDFIKAMGKTTKKDKKKK